MKGEIILFVGQLEVFDKAQFASLQRGGEFFLNLAEGGLFR